jgi:ribosome-binding ATPase
MGFTCGLVGLPNAGKSTIFNALSNAGARVENYPFCTIDANVGTVAVPDPRLDHLSAVFPEKKKVHTHLEFVDIAGLVEHAADGEGMGNQFLSEIRTVDAIVHVVRCFEDANVAHVTGSIDAIRDIGIIETELLLKDLETLGRVADRLSRETKGKDRSAPARLADWKSLLEQVTMGNPIRTLPIQHSIESLIAETSPLTAKPSLFVANVGDDGESQQLPAIQQIADNQGSLVVPIRGRLEAEIGEVAGSPEESASYLGQYGMTETGLDLLVRAGYDLLNLVTFFTFEGPEVRAWTVPAGTTAPDAGARIHSDFSDRFVLAEVMDVDELVAAGSEKPLREAGHIRRAGHDYVVSDGDVIHFICS